MESRSKVAGLLQRMLKCRPRRKHCRICSGLC